MLAKRVFDLIVAGILLVVTLPIWIVIIMGVLVSSPGPIFYRGLRTGRHGRPFRILKFRTMRPDAERVGGGTTALNDPRVFPFGRLLRYAKLDELPQLINVLLGEMSMVGPRPELPVYTDRYTAEEREILAVPPGITDYSSIRFSSLDTIVGAQDADQNFETNVLPEKNRLRLEYARNRTFFGDLAILALTVRCVLLKLFQRRAS
ncbi:MAG: sugar transferase [Opitutaceae bacterium]|nr:sugar transferase [Opitutaceae bacterium]